MHSEEAVRSMLAASGSTICHMRCRRLFPLPSRRQSRTFAVSLPVIFYNVVRFIFGEIWNKYLAYSGQYLREAICISISFILYPREITFSYSFLETVSSISL
eukprot:GHVT01083625.1.p1 GENE.GHVT01083625.1~~GHVT01083625.1.p1  ORF type:complete len:102 (+),score=0.93 GHVT01083625.1:119-424(+)